MKLTIPFHRQDTDYTCGPAALQMLLHHFNGVYPSEEELAERLRTTGVDGTQHVNLVRVLQEEGLHVYVDHSASLESVESLLKIGLPVLIHYIEPEENLGHYAVVVGITEDRLYFNDPWHGSGFSLSREEFSDRWCDGFGIHTQWLLVASKTPLLPDLHFDPKEVPKADAQ